MAFSNRGTHVEAHAGASRNRYLVGDVIMLAMQKPTDPVWIVYDAGRRRFAVEPEGRAGRIRVQVGPYAIESTIWQISHDVDTALDYLRQKLGMRG